MVMVYSASIAMPDNPRFSRYSHTHFLFRHVISMVVGCIMALLVFQVRMETWEKAARPLFVFSLVLLAVVLIPFIGKGVNGARRWISFGVLNFQPSELAKLATIIYAADYMVRKMDVKEKFFKAVLPMGAAIGLAGVFLLAEPDMGAFMVIATIAMGILFLGGVNARMFFLILGILILAFVVMIAESPWRRERIFAYLDPFSAEHALGKGYQLTHSLIAIGRGEVWGVGLGGSVEKLHWLPEAHTDFLLAVWPGGRDTGHRPVPVAQPPHHGDWAAGHCTGKSIFRPGRARRGHLDWISSLHQHGCEPGGLAHQGSDAAPDELWRLGHHDEPDRDCHRAAH
jgi:cell division protein FtsW